MTRQRVETSAGTGQKRRRADAHDGLEGAGSEEPNGDLEALKESVLARQTKRKAATSDVSDYADVSTAQPRKKKKKKAATSEA